MSKIANEHGLQLSLLERLTKHPAYLRNEEFSSVGGYNPCLVYAVVYVQQKIDEWVLLGDKVD